MAYSWRQLCCVNLVDAQFCTDGARFLSACLVSLLTMTRLELPHVNVLSKVDLLRSYGPLGEPLRCAVSCVCWWHARSLPLARLAPACSLEFFAEGMDMTRLASIVTGSAGGGASPQPRGGDGDGDDGGGDARGGEVPRGVDGGDDASPPPGPVRPRIFRRCAWSRPPNSSPWTDALWRGCRASCGDLF